MAPVKATVPAPHADAGACSHVGMKRRTPGHERFNAMHEQTSATAATLVENADLRLCRGVGQCNEQLAPVPRARLLKLVRVPDAVVLRPGDLFLERASAYRVTPSSAISARALIKAATSSRRPRSARITES